MTFRVSPSVIAICVGAACRRHRSTYIGSTLAKQRFEIVFLLRPLAVLLASSLVQMGAALLPAIQMVKFMFGISAIVNNSLAVKNTTVGSGILPLALSIQF